MTVENVAEQSVRRLAAATKLGVLARSLLIDQIVDTATAPMYKMHRQVWLDAFEKDEETIGKLKRSFNEAQQHN